MSDNGHPSSRERHQAAEDERSRLRKLERHEREVRDREKTRILAHMLPVEQRYDDTGFANGCVL